MGPHTHKRANENDDICLYPYADILLDENDLELYGIALSQAEHSPGQRWVQLSAIQDSAESLLFYFMTFTSQMIVSNNNFFIGRLHLQRPIIFI